jgi:serine/threonine-protein kinase
MAGSEDINELVRSDTAAELAIQEELTKPADFVAEFRLARALGQGAMGQVFLAQDTFLDRPVAIKLLTTGETTPRARERFFVEARAVARLQHPNVVMLYRAGEEQGKRYLVSEYVRGQSLERIPKPLPWPKVLELGLGLARGLAAAHQRGVLHRDIKPANTMLTDDGQIKILDFGLAKLVATQGDGEKTSADESGSLEDAQLPESLHVSTVALTRTGTLLGTPLYMAPELWLHKPATTQTDVFSLGAMLYELCTGSPPYLAETVPALRVRIVNEDAKPLAAAAPSVDMRLAAVIDRCLQRDPAKRFTSAEEVRQALEHLAAKAPSISRRVAAAGLSALLALFVVLAGVSVWRERQAKKQAMLAQRLGQQIKDMEWTLRSARQLPLHDLNHEKDIVRKRMAEMQAEMLGYGSLGRGLAHYALGRGHLALHEYPQALADLEQAIQLGYQDADAYYALGLVLGLHYKQAKAELRDAGPPSWVKKQLRPLEARYLTPAIDALKRSRQLQPDASPYLEGLIAFYQGDYETALSHAQVAQREAPWLYEAATLAGDIYVERGEYARSQKSYEEVDRQLSNGVSSYERAAAIGQSDSEVYENLVSAWFSRMRVASVRGQPIDSLYAAAVAASDKSIITEPDSIVGRLRRTQAASWALETMTGGGSTTERLKDCLTGAEGVLNLHPAHPIATHYAAFCYLAASELATTRGEDPVPLLRQAINLLEPLVRKEPNRYNASHDLSAMYASLAEQLVLRGDRDSNLVMLRGLEYAQRTADLDDEVYQSLIWSLEIRRFQILTAATEQEVQTLLIQVDAEFDRIMVRNEHEVYALDTHLGAYAAAAFRAYLAKKDPLPLLKRAQASLARARQLGGNFGDLERNALLVHYVDASAKVLAQQDPGPALLEMEEDRKRCLALDAKDVTCLALAARAGWVESEWLAQRGQPALPPLQRALQRAIEATQSPQTLADAWQILAETYLRLSRSGEPPAEMKAHIAQGLLAVQKVFALNPNHAQGMAIQGALLLGRSKQESDLTMRQSSAQEAVQVLLQALRRDPLLEHELLSNLEAARALAVQEKSPV